MPSAILLRACAALLILASIVARAHAADPPVKPPAGWAVVGPHTEPTKTDQGIDVNTDFWAFLNIKITPPPENKATLELWLIADFRDLRAKLGSIVDAGLRGERSDNCFRMGSFENLVFELPQRSLSVPDRDTLETRLAGKAVGWWCYSNPVPETFYEPNCWSIHNPFGGSDWVMGCIRGRVAPPWKGEWISQGFNGETALKIVARGPKSVEIKPSEPTFRQSPGQIIRSWVSIASLGLLHAPDNFDQLLADAFGGLLRLAGVHPQQLLARSIHENTALQNLKWEWSKDLLELGVKYDDAYFEDVGGAPLLHIRASASPDPKATRRFADRWFYGSFFPKPPSPPPCTDQERLLQLPKCRDISRRTIQDFMKQAPVADPPFDRNFDRQERLQQQLQQRR